MPALSDSPRLFILGLTSDWLLQLLLVPDPASSNLSCGLAKQLFRPFDLDFNKPYCTVTRFQPNTTLPTVTLT